MVKVMDVDKVRKRIALSIKQTQEAPKINSHQASGHPRPGNYRQNISKQYENKNESMEDALSLLKKKFGR
jgi:protein Tex